MRPARGPLAVVALAVAVGLATPACSRNPATGRLQFALIDESEEIAIGKKGDAEIQEALRLYDEKPAVNAIVQRVGKKIAASSERPGLPWTFRVIDDPTVNAFALPGGFVYVTRGLLVHLNSEDELAAVLGHEAGHVTARHGAVQLRKTRVAQRSVGVFRVIDPNLRHVGGIAARTAGLALLKYSREDEHQADDLSLRYVERNGYDIAAVPEIFRILAGVSNKAGGKVPAWLSTHPEPEARRSRVAAKIGAAAERPPSVDPKYLKVIDGVVHGADPRDGYFVGVRFVHPRVGFRVDVPKGWEGDHDATGVVALSPDKRALFVLAPSDHATPSEALEAFFADGTVARGEGWKGKVGGFTVLTSAFAIPGDQENIAGLLAFIDYDGRVLAMIAVGPESGWSERTEVIAASFASFRRLTEPALRDVEPMRIRVTEAKDNTTLAEFTRKHPSVIPIEELALLNHVSPDTPLVAGRPVKRVLGFNPAITAATR